MIIFYFVFASIQIYGLNFSIAAYQQHGKTFIQETYAAPINYEEIKDFNKAASGNFIQGLVHYKKFAVGIEYGFTKLYYIYYKYWEPYSYRYRSNTYKPKNLSLIIQYNLFRHLYIQGGIGNYYLNKLLDDESSAGYLFSISYHLKISEFIKIPIFSRAILLTSRGNPTALTVGAGIIFFWK